jgi:hypothetical protein
MKRKPMTERELNWLAGLLVDKMLTLLGHRIAGYHDRPTLFDVARNSEWDMLPVIEALSQRNPLLESSPTGHRITTRTGLPQVTWKKRGPQKGTKMSAKQMRCRHKGCKNRSRGPRFHYLCKKHPKG